MIRIRDGLIKNESGSAFILALIFLAVGALTITPILGLFSTELSSLNLGTSRLKELYAADSGVEHAMWNIENNGNLLPGYNNQPPPYAHSLPGINGKNVNYSIVFVDINMYKVTSIATSATGSNTTIEAYVATPQGGIFANAVTVTDGDLTLSGTVSSSPEAGVANLYADGSITGNGNVAGNITATGSISGVVATGISTPNAVPQNFPPISTTLYLDQANEGTLITGNYNSSSSSSLGPAHITGNLKLTGGATLTLTGTLWVDGTISIEGGSTVSGAYTIVSDSTNSNGAISVNGGTSVGLGSTPLFIATRGGINVTGGSTISAVMYAPNGSVKVSGSGTTVIGSVAGKSADISGNIMYPSELQHVLQLPGCDLPRVITWKIM